MTAPDVTELPTVPAPADARPASLVLAGLHLRLGSLALARAELETLAEDGALDQGGRVDLAEVRWRTGDLVGAGDVAQEAIAAGDASVVALVVAAEAASALGRPTEARRLAGQALARMGGPIDPVFAGMPRSGVWPADPAEPVPSPATLFPPERAGGGSGTSGDTETSSGSTTAAAAKAASAAAVAATTAGARSAGNGSSPSPGAAVVADRDGTPSGSSATESGAADGSSLEPGFWDLPPVEQPLEGSAMGRPAEPQEPTPLIGLDPAAILDAGEAALASRDYASAALHLGLAVRVSPSIAPAILDAIGDTPDPGLQMVRGDAYRAVGRETDARRAYAAAMAAAAARPASADRPPVDDAGVGHDGDLEDHGA